MNHYTPKPGYIYDAVAVLTRYLDETEPSGLCKKQIESNYYASIVSMLAEFNIVIPHYLYPFTCRYKERRPLLSSLLLDSHPYAKHSFEHAKTMLENNQFLRRRFAEYYFNSSDHRSIFKTAQEHPSCIDMLKQQAADPSVSMYIHYTLIHFDKVAETLAAVFQSLYIVIESAHKEFVIKNPGFLHSFQSGANVEKLKMLAGIKEAPRFSISLLTPDMISTKIDDPGFFLLGYMCGDILDARHKHLNATPFTLAEAIGNPVRYDIYRALLARSPMTRFEMEKQLCMSRGSLDHNLEVMRDKGLLVVDHQTGLTRHYRLDPEYIRTVAELLLDDVRAL